MNRKLFTQSAPARRTLGEGVFFNPRVLVTLLLCGVALCSVLSLPLAMGQRGQQALSQRPSHAPSNLDGPTWTFTGSLNTARFLHTATLLPSGVVLVTGGLDNTFNATESTELYDPASGSWTATGNLNTARYEHTATLLPNGNVLVAGGSESSGNASTSAELYDPITGTWTVTGSLNTERTEHTATLLPNGKVLVAVAGSDKGDK